MLTLHRLFASNFKRHERLDLTFTKGVNLILGPNASGKTTVLYAIRYALGGMAAVPFDADDILRHGASRMVVKLWLQGDGDNAWRVDRTKTGADLWRTDQGVNFEGEWTRVATGANPVKAALEELLGCSIRRYLDLRCNEQNKTQAMLGYNSTFLTQLLEELANATVLNRVLNKASGELAVQEGVIRTLGEFSAVGVPELERQLEMARHEARRLRGLTSASETMLADWKEKLAQAQQARQQWLEACERFDAWEDRDMQLASAQLTARKAELKAKQDASKLAPEAESLAELERLTDLERAAYGALVEGRTQAHGHAERLRSYRLAHEGWQRGRRMVEEAKGALAHSELAWDGSGGDNQLKLLSDRQGLLDKLVEDSQEALTTARAKLSGLRSQLRNLVAPTLADTECPACRRPFADAAEVHAHHQQAMIEYEAELERLTVAVRTAEAKADEKAATLQHAQHSRGTGLTALKEQEALKHSLEQARVQLADLRQRGLIDQPEPEAVPETCQVDVAKLEADLQEARRRLQAQQSLKSEAQQCRAAAAKASEQARLADAALEAHRANRPDPVGEEPSDPETLSINVRRLQEEHNRDQAELRRLEVEAGRLAAQLENEKVLHVKRQEALGRRTSLKTFVKYLRDNRDRFMAELWDGVMLRASAFVAACTDGRIERLYRSAEGVYRFVEAGRDAAVDGNASGAQRSAMGVGIQIALAQMKAGGLGTMLCDEVSADMDVKVSAALTALLSSLPQQTIMISHRELDSGLADNVIVMEEAA